MTTTLWLSLGLTVWVVGACAVGLALGAVVRLREQSAPRPPAALSLPVPDLSSVGSG